MRFKRSLLPALFALLVGALPATEFVWVGHGTISFDIPPGWKLQGQPAEEIGYVFRAQPEAKIAALLQITLVHTPPDKPVVAGELTERLRDSLEPYIEESVEKEFRPVKMKCRQGQGWYAELTDAALLGKPPVADDYKRMRSALLALDARTLVVATMQFDDAAMEAPGEMLGIVGSMRFEPSGEKSSR